MAIVLESIAKSQHYIVEASAEIRATIEQSREIIAVSRELIISVEEVLAK